jgi:hypothetical protein
MVGYRTVIALSKFSMVSIVYLMLDYNLFSDTEENLRIIFLVLCLG